MNSSSKNLGAREQKLHNIYKCSRIPIKLYSSDTTKNNRLFVINSYKTNGFPQIIPEAKPDTNSGLINIANDEKNKNENKHFAKSERSVPGFKKNFFEYCVEYANNTSIQGVKYIGEQAKSVFERLAWFAFFCLSIYFCIDLSIQIYIKWDISPVLVSFARSPTPIWKIPFPAVTVCSETKTRQAVYNFTHSYRKLKDNPENITNEELRKLADMALICDNTVYHEGNLTTGYDTIKFLANIAPPLEELIWLCQYITYRTSSCNNLFTPIMTDEGLCYTFNMLDKSEVYSDRVYSLDGSVPDGKKSHGWTLGTGYMKHTPVDTYPRRAISESFQFRFVFILRAYTEDFDYICKGPVHGFKILLHNPAEIPMVGMNYFRAPLTQELILAVKPDMMTTSDSLRNYDPHRRQCYFPEEHYLAFFRSYTQESCELECLTNFTRTKCGCIGYYMPHEKGTPICSSGNIDCMAEARSQLVDRKVKLGMDMEASDSYKPTGCDCLPSCTSLVYNAETSQANFNFEKYAVEYQLNMSEYGGARVTRIIIFFKESDFISTERNELFDRINFLASCGSILGLFTGFSFLSLVELLYFLTIRLLYNLNKYGKHYWSGSEELTANDIYDHKK